jgi:hypothetical protein
VLIDGFVDFQGLVLLTLEDCMVSYRKKQKRIEGERTAYVYADAIRIEGESVTTGSRSRPPKGRKLG